jgi:hypothetical protein
MLERMKLDDALDVHFCLLDLRAEGGAPIPEARSYHNRRFRTLHLHKSFDKDGRLKSAMNVLELRDGKVFRELLVSYGPEIVRRAARSIVEPHIHDLSFGWANLSERSYNFTIDVERWGMTAAKLARWIERSCGGRVLTLEGNRFVRASFAEREDFHLATLRYMA